MGLWFEVGWNADGDVDVGFIGYLEMGMGFLRGRGREHGINMCMLWREDV